MARPNIYPNRRNKNPNMLEGLSEIAGFIGKGIDTTRSWIMNHGLPATRMPNGMWLTHKGLILHWMCAGHQQIVQDRARYILETDEILKMADEMNVNREELLERMEELEDERRR